MEKNNDRLARMSADELEREASRLLAQAGFNREAQPVGWIDPDDALAHAAPVGACDWAVED